MKKENVSVELAFRILGVTSVVFGLMLIVSGLTIHSELERAKQQIQRYYQNLGTEVPPGMSIDDTPYEMALVTGSVFMLIGVSFIFIPWLLGRKTRKHPTLSMGRRL